jgi:hypothetical protein
LIDSFNNEDQAHYENENADLDFSPEMHYGEEYNAKFLAELGKLKAEKGADYFRNYPSKDELMGDSLRPVWDNIVNVPNMGKGAEQHKEVDRIAQSGSRSR